VIRRLPIDRAWKTGNFFDLLGDRVTAMKPFVRPLLLLAILCTITRAEEPLPSDPAPQEEDWEPQLLLIEEPAPAPESAQKGPKDVTEAEEAVAEAEQRAVLADKLWKRGVLAKIELEARQIEVIRLKMELALTRLNSALAEADAANASASPEGKAEIAAIHQKIVAAAQEHADAATEDWKAAQAAVGRIARYRKLMLGGASTRAQLTHAQAELNELRNRRRPKFR
jgi:hypothetical protein